MRFGLISLGATSAQWIVERAKKYFEVAEHINLKDISVKITHEGKEVYYKNQPLDKYHCL